ncbi:MAG: hypothetical protein AB7R77_06005 [Ilumatobacteraceae bacterium]
MSEGYRDFTSGSTLAAADLEEYCELQTIMRFADASAGDTALSAVKTEGMRRYLKDTNCDQTYSGSAWSSTGPLHGAGISWTPTVTQSGSVSVTVSRARYWRLGRKVDFQCKLSVTGSGSSSNDVVISLPVTAAAADLVCAGNGLVYDATGPTWYSGVPYLASTTTMKLAVTGNVVYLGTSGFTSALASGDLINIAGWYEAASDA